MAKDGFRNHTATHTTPQRSVVVNGEELKSGIKYGYGSAYLQTAADLLRVNGYEVPTNNNEAFYKMCEYPHDAEDVDRKKDL